MRVGPSRFSLVKWYLDCVTDQGDAAILYCANLRWRGIRATYSSILTVNEHSTESHSTMTRYQLSSGDSQIVVESPRLKVAGRWQADAAPVERPVYENDTGSVVWKCLQPRSQVNLRVGEREFIGLGYAECLIHVNLWVVFAAICVAAPWIQGLGRLRCLVQGCCHGHATKSVPGIRYTHPRSRVCRLAHLTGVAVHATQLYSILCNAVVGLALLRLFQLHSSATLICGVYLLLSGAGRFVEEAYRGEPQTLTLYGLRLYQWIAILTAVAGAAITCVHGPALPPSFTFRGSAIWVALGCSAMAWFVTGVDFPESSRRFARLT